MFETPEKSTISNAGKFDWSQASCGGLLRSAKDDKQGASENANTSALPRPT